MLSFANSIKSLKSQSILLSLKPSLQVQIRILYSQLYEIQFNENNIIDKKKIKMLWQVLNKHEIDFSVEGKKKKRKMKNVKTLKRTRYRKQPEWMANSAGKCGGREASNWKHLGSFCK